MPSFNELTQTAAKNLITLIHLGQSGLMLGQGDVQLVHSLRRARADGDERRRVIQGSNRNLVLLLVDLAGEKANAPRHLVDATNLTDEGALEGVDVGIQLSTSKVNTMDTLLRALDAYVFELNIPKLSKFSNSVMRNFRRHKQLHRAHSLGALLSCVSCQ